MGKAFHDASTKAIGKRNEGNRMRNGRDFMLVVVDDEHDAVDSALTCADALTGV
jgi:hypothetical protein